MTRRQLLRRRIPLGLRLDGLPSALRLLLAQREQYRSIFEATTDGLAINDFETGRLLAANPALCRMHGYDDMTGMHPTQFIHPDSQHLFEEFLRVTRAGGEFRCRARDVRRDGSVFDVEVTGRAFVYQGRPALLGVVRDVSEQTHSEQQYRGVFEATTDSLLIHAPGDLRVVEANPAACAMFGYSREELLGKLPSQLMQPGSWDPDFINAIADGRPRRTRATGVRRDGTTFEMESAGVPFLFRGGLHLLCVQRDVTEQVRGEQLLERRVEARTRELATLLEVSRNVAMTLDLATLLNLMLREARRVVDYHRATFSLMDGQELVVAAVAGSRLLPQRRVRRDMGRRFAPAPGEALWEAVLGGYPILIDDVNDDSDMARSWQRVMVAAGASVANVRSWMAVPLVIKGRVVGLLSMSRAEPGYFERRHVELTTAFAGQAAVAVENARLYDQAQQAAVLDERQRLARELHDSVSQALYGIALGASTARTLLRRQPQAALEPIEYVLSLAEAALVEMRALIFELRPEFLENEGLVAAIGKRVEATAVRHGLQVEWAPPPEPEVPLAVKEAAFRIVQEALHNVVKHARARRVTVRLDTAPGSLLLEVSDDGAGFEDEEPAVGHLGLQSMRERAANLGGQLEVISAPGQGTTVRGRLPVP